MGFNPEITRNYQLGQTEGAPFWIGFPSREHDLNHLAGCAAPLKTFLRSEWPKKKRQGGFPVLSRQATRNGFMGRGQLWGVLDKMIKHSRGTFPILSRDPSFQETIKNPGETDPVFEKNDG